MLIVRPAPAELPIPLADGFLTILRRRPQPASGSAAGEAGGKTAPPSVAPHLLALLRLLGQAGPLGNAEILARLGLKDRVNLYKRYLAPALDAGFIEQTIPDKPHSRSQQYRLTAKGKTLLASLR